MRRGQARTRFTVLLVMSLLTVGLVFTSTAASLGQPVLGGAGAQPVIELDPATATNPVGTDHELTATVTVNGVPLEGAAVHFAVDDEGAPTPQAGDGTTSVEGTTTFTFSNGEAATNTITACVEVVVDQECGPGEEATTATKSWQVREPDEIALDPASDTNPVGSTHNLTATVTDQFGDPFEGADVHFDVSADGNPSPTGGDASTDAAGEAAFDFTNDTVSTNTITACIDLDASGSCGGEPSDTATKAWETPVPTSIDVTPASDVNHPGDDHSLTATVTDQFGAPVAGIEVRIAVTGTGSPTPSSLTALTNASGEVHFTFTNPVVALNLIEACFTVGMADVCDTATKSWEVPAPTTIELAPELDTNPVGSTHNLTATVTDQFGDPFEGADVHFDVSADGNPSPTGGDASTDAAGEAAFDFTNDTVSTNTITACIDLDASGSCAGEPSDTATKAWEEREPSAVGLAPAGDTNPVGSTHVLTATASDQFGDPVAGVVILFAVSSEGSPSPASGVGLSDASGHAAFSFTNGTAVTNTIVACLDIDPQNGACDAGEPTASATKTWRVRLTCPGFAGSPRNQIVGTPGNDRLIGTAGPDIICGLGGDDRLVGKRGNDLLLGGRGRDAMLGRDGRDRLNGGAGGDRLKGGTGNDRLKGNAGPDRLNGGSGFDVCLGGPGADVVRRCEA